MFIAILDGQFTELSSDEGAKDNKGFFELIISIIVEKYATKNNKETYETIPPNAGTMLKLKIKTTNTLKKLREFVVRQAKIILFGRDGRDADPEEKAKLKEEMQRNMMDAKLKFEKKDDEDRDAALQDVQMYLNDDLDMSGKDDKYDNLGPHIGKKDDEDDRIY